MRTIKLSDMQRIVVGVDPPGGIITECGIVVAGKGFDEHGYVLDDKSMTGTPGEWSSTVINAFTSWRADCIVAEANFGGLMVEATIIGAAAASDQVCRYKNVHASRGKAVRAEPIVARYEKGVVHHVGEFSALEDEMVSWVPGESKYSPNRIDALVWALTELFIEQPLQFDSPLPVPSGGSSRFMPY